MTAPRNVCANCLRATRSISRNVSIRQFSQVSRGNQLHHLTNTARQAFNTTKPTRITTQSPATTPAFQIQTIRRHASTSPPTPSPSNHTIAVLNPRPDPENPDSQMTIEISQRATKRLKKIITKDANPGLCLRVSVESGGCHGFQYLMSLTSSEKIDAEEDTLFVAREEGMDDFEAGGEDYAEIGRGRAKVVMDEASLELLKGSKVDFTEELIGSQFVITENPRAVSSCGCGTSFDVKM